MQRQLYSLLSHSETRAKDETKASAPVSSTRTRSSQTPMTLPQCRATESPSKRNDGFNDELNLP
jgi:hypothetical protein